VKVLRAFKTELDPNNVQRTLLLKAAGTARFAWNWGLGRRIAEHKATGKSSTAITQHRQLNALKATDFPWMYDVSKCAPQEALRDLDKAYQSFFRRVKAGEKPGFPRFKSRHKTLPHFRIGSICPVAAGKVKLPRIGWVRLKEHGYLPITGMPGVRVLSTTVKGTGSGRWFVSVQCEVEAPDPKPAENAVERIGLDVGLKSFVTLSDGTKVEPPKALWKAMRRVKRLQRRVSRRVKGGMNRRKAVWRLNAAHFRVSCRRSDWLHKLTTMLVRTKPAKLYVVEGLDIRNMVKNHKLAGAISDAGWGEFFRQLEYKAQARGLEVMRAPRFFASSKTCSGCGAVKETLKLSERTYECGSCGLVMDRDLNAARNLALLPRVPREGTPGESAARKAPRRTRKETGPIPLG
jgi:putative transposase